MSHDILTFIGKCRYNYDKEKTSRLVNAKYKNAKLYWNLLKDAAGIKSSNIQLSTFEQYFKYKIRNEIL